MCSATRRCPLARHLLLEGLNALLIQDLSDSLQRADLVLVNPQVLFREETAHQRVYLAEEIHSNSLLNLRVNTPLVTHAMETLRAELVIPASDADHLEPRVAFLWRIADDQLYVPAATT